MAGHKSARIEWTGEELDLKITLGKGYEFSMTSAPGPGRGGTPMDFLLASAAGCTAMDVISILRKKRLQVDDFTVEINGQQAEEHPHVFTAAQILFIVRGENISPEAVERAIELSQTKYCSASIMLRRAGVDLTTDYRIESF